MYERHRYPLVVEDDVWQPYVAGRDAQLINYSCTFDCGSLLCARLSQEQTDIRYKMYERHRYLLVGQCQCVLTTYHMHTAYLKAKYQREYN